jgi:hypothetical protein
MDKKETLHGLFDVSGGPERNVGCRVEKLRDGFDYVVEDEVEKRLLGITSREFFRGQRANVAASAGRYHVQDFDFYGTNAGNVYEIANNRERTRGCKCLTTQTTQKFAKYLADERERKPSSKRDKAPQGTTRSRAAMQRRKQLHIVGRKKIFDNISHCTPLLVSMSLSSV